MTEDRFEVVISVPADTPISELVTGEQRVVEINSESKSVVEQEERTFKNSSPKFTEGQFALDHDGATASSEANTVRITEVTDVRADEYTVEETGKTVAEHNPNYQSSDRVIIGHYPNVSGSNQEFAFPESRLSLV